MTEAIEAAKRILAAVRKRSDKHATEYELTGNGFVGLEAPYEVATELLRLAEPEWGEPKAEGWHWIEGINLPCYVYRTEPEDVADNDTWSFSGFDVDGYGYDYRGLNGRRVAPCVGRPRKAGE